MSEREPISQPVPETPKPVDPRVSIDEFKKFRIVTAEIKEVAAHPNADKLYVLQVDTGSDVRQIVAGIKRSYAPEQLVGKKIALIANLEPAVIRGVESNGMLLAASDENGPAILTPERDVPPGSPVK
ncbi:MAG: methionine--tRNA ligase subunit beta [Elusimicrobia bacterium]|nr:methionine--tRNA ligase subunit beta [Elusimicrobiota bacterium]